MTTPVEKIVREIRINPIVPSESVLVATARGMRPKKAEEPAPPRRARPQPGDRHADHSRQRAGGGHEQPRVPPQESSLYLLLAD